MRKFLSDTLAMIIFSTVVGLVVEIVVSGMTFEQSIHARIAAIPLNLLTARPYGVFRDKIFSLFSVGDGECLKKSIVDIFTFTIFQVPLYIIVLVFSGANIFQIVKACTTITVFSVFAGRPYGILLEFSRSLFKIE